MKTRSVTKYYINKSVKRFRYNMKIRSIIKDYIDKSVKRLRYDMKITEPCRHPKETSKNEKKVMELYERKKINDG